MAVCRGPPDRACVVHYKTGEVLVKQDAVSDGQATPVKEGTENAQSLSRLPT